MATVTEPYLALGYVYDTLSADTTITAAADVYTDRDDEPGGTRKVLIEMLTGGLDEVALDNGATRIWSEVEVQVTAWETGTTSYDGIDPIAARIDADLHGVGGVTVTGGQIVTIYRARAPQHGVTREEDTYNAYVRQQFRVTARTT